MRITLVIFSLSSGGAERVMSIIANYWAARNESITLVTFDSIDNDFYPLNDRIQRVALNLKAESKSVVSAIKHNIIRLKRLRKAIKNSQPEVVLSFIDKMSVVTLFATRGLSLPVIVSEHIDPRQLPPGGIWNSLRRWSYSWANAVVVLTMELKNVLAEFVDENKIYVIPNPALPDKEEKDTSIPFKLPLPFIVAMGRLNPQKGFDLLLEAFARCSHNAWSLVVLGEGAERERLETQVKELGLNSRVFLPGTIENPKRVMRKAGLFVLSSRFEGFPMVVLEAMSCGLPVISFNCPTGPSDIISDGIDGILVPPGDIAALAATMDSLMEDGEKRHKLASEAQKVVDRFSIEKIMEKWDALLRDAIRPYKTAISVDDN